MQYNVVIIDTRIGEIVETMTCSTEKAAERVERGVNINLNHEHFYTEIHEVED